MLAEYGLVPDIFDSTRYSCSKVYELYLSKLKEELLNYGIVGDFRQGEWRTYVTTRQVAWDKRAKELIKKLIVQNRLALRPSAGRDTPEDDFGWCLEAIESDRSHPLATILTGAEIASRFKSEPKVRSIERFGSAAGGRKPGNSVRLRRCTADYLTHLGPILKHANSIMFIDPHLDPSRRNYEGFLDVLLATSRASGQPHLEIHRGRYSGRTRDPIAFTELRSMFSELGTRLEAARLKVEVFVWDRFHDRFLLSNLIGILMANGFDVSQRANSMTVWAAITREDRSALQSEFSPLNNSCHQLCDRFTIGLGSSSGITHSNALAEQSALRASQHQYL